MIATPNVGTANNGFRRKRVRPFPFCHRLYGSVAYQNNMRCRALALLLLAFSTPCAPAAEPGDDVVSNIARLPVESSALLSVGYSKTQRILEVEFRKEGMIYRYLEVPENVFRELLEAPSKAGYYNENIRGHYRSLHVVKPDGQ
jgi:hypothetical protein